MSPRPGKALRVLVDGGSGSGKTTFAGRLRAELATQLDQDVQLVHLDDFYPGWHGLAEASRMVIETVLRAEAPGYWRWDWTTGTRADWVPLDAHKAMVVEGCGALTRSSRDLAHWAVWLEMDAPSRKLAALARDAGAFDPWWGLWAEQESLHWQENRPWTLADSVITRVIEH